jgi:hypothetical protein
MMLCTTHKDIDPGVVVKYIYSIDESVTTLSLRVLIKCDSQNLASYGIVDQLALLVNSHYSSVRIALARLLLHIGTEHSMKVLDMLKKDTDEIVRLYATR